ncbi:metallophosphoesterase family protein [Cellulomonas sp. ICMP 17802]|uniref:metallophosphoesterase family protein n=1 Tax=Cellulomonas sp. ICMP 17802 TaxID=3239199 RepID=UPI00351AB83F
MTQPALSPLRVAVLSDLHAFSRANALPGIVPNDGQLCLDEAQIDPYRHPFAGIWKLIADEGLRADVVLCGGDMTDKSAPEPARRVWELIQETALRLGATTVLGAVGNHDWDSRALHNPDPRHIVYPMHDFPTNRPVVNTNYWAHYWAEYDDGATRYILVNSCAYQRNGTEYLHGRVTKESVDQIRESLQSAPHRTANILLTHHHLHRVGTIDLEDYSEMTGGHLLLEALDEANVGPWMVVHGHKHMPMLNYASGSSTSPVVLSAGSFSAELYSELAGRARNQFYLIELDPETASDLGLSIAGRFRAFDWAPALGWTPANAASQLPGSGGFGCRTDPLSLARRLEVAVRASGQPWLERDEIAAILPELCHLLPPDETALKTRLEELGLEVRLGSAHIIETVSMPRTEILAAIHADASATVDVPNSGSESVRA